MRKKILQAIETVRPFVPVMQLKTLVDALRWGEERGWFRDKLLELAQVVETMPVTYAQDGLGDEAVVHLHYFYGGGDWWITEKDIDGGVDQAFGLVDLGHGPELGYISIAELVSMRDMDIDLHWKPITLAQVKAEKYKVPEPVKPELVAYTVAQVVNVGDWFETVAPGFLN
ncbi:MAG: hypothetical protein A3E79_11815 [Burkholderiales bacterium RIFCSPHIGHO2_12_FULL_61_11]|nr:MAG: hypothetical protein A3E79_11815 [Burkholderiales bacterium RIFCSPHIGHO2_12_FULL_61_11]